MQKTREWFLRKWNSSLSSKQQQTRQTREWEENHIIGDPYFLPAKTNKKKDLFSLLFSLTFRVNTWAIFTSKIPSSAVDAAAGVYVFDVNGALWVQGQWRHQKTREKETQASRLKTPDTVEYVKGEENNELIVFEQEENSLSNVTTWEREEETRTMWNVYSFATASPCLNRHKKENCGKRFVVSEKKHKNKQVILFFRLLVLSRAYFTLRNGHCLKRRREKAEVLIRGLDESLFFGS